MGRALDIFPHRSDSIASEKVARPERNRIGVKFTGRGTRAGAHENPSNRREVLERLM
jgi:hypothetical protein